jgi:hypothetical protein
MAFKLPSHLHRARSGILHFRIAIPPDVRQYFTIREIYRSLHTASVREAAPLAQTLSEAAKRIFQQIRSETMPDQKKPPGDSSGGIPVHLITEISLDEFSRSKLRLIPQPGDTPEDKIQAQVEFFRANAIAEVGRQRSTIMIEQRSPLLPELAQDYKRDRLAANKWTAKTQDENMAVYKLCIDIIGDLPLSEIDEDRALTYVETLKNLLPTLIRCRHFEERVLARLSL